MSEVADGVFVSRVGEQVLEPDEETGGSVHVLRDDDDVQAGIWAGPEQGVIGPMEFDHHETIYVIAGEVDIEIEGGSTIHLAPGDLASFRAGVRATWRPQPGFREVWVYG